MEVRLRGGVPKALLDERIGRPAREGPAADSTKSQSSAAASGQRIRSTFARITSVYRRALHAPAEAGSAADARPPPTPEEVVAAPVARAFCGRRSRARGPSVGERAPDERGLEPGGPLDHEHRAARPPLHQHDRRFSRAAFIRRRGNLDGVDVAASEAAHTVNTARTDRLAGGDDRRRSSAVRSRGRERRRERAHPGARRATMMSTMNRPRHLTAARQHFESKGA